MRVLAGAAPPEVERFEVAWLDAVEGEQRCRLEAVAGVAFESVPPVRSLPSYKGQRNYPGLYWSATMGRHVGFESWLERDHAVLLDFDPDVAGYSSQPMWLFWPESTKSGRRWRSHAPDFFARRADGSVLLIDCRPADRISPRDQRAFDATARAAALVEWDYRVVDAPDSVVIANVRWLAGYRHPRFAEAAEHRGQGSVVRITFGHRRQLDEGVRTIGDPIAVLPVVYHLMWRGQLGTDMMTPFSPQMLVGPPLERSC